MPNVAYGGGGGGGRVIVIATIGISSFTGSTLASGGVGFQSGSAGTVFKSLPVGSELVIDNYNIKTVLSTSIAASTSYTNGLLYQFIIIRNGQAILRNGVMKSFKYNTLLSDTTGSLTVSNSTILSPITPKFVPSGSSLSLLNVTAINLYIENGILNATDIVIGNSGSLHLSELGQSSDVRSSTSMYYFNNIQVNSGGNFIYDYDNQQLCDLISPPVRIQVISNTVTINSGGTCTPTWTIGQSDALSVCVVSKLINGTYVLQKSDTPNGIVNFADSLPDTNIANETNYQLMCYELDPLTGNKTSTTTKYATCYINPSSKESN